MQSWKPELYEIPVEAGVYRFWKNNTILYIGKAKNLRNRLGSYLRKNPDRDERIQKMLNETTKLTWTLTETETNALIVERDWINTYNPPYNIALKDSAIYPGIALTNEPTPRLVPFRKTIPRNATIYGPWPGTNVEEIITLIASITKIATCDWRTYQRAAKNKKPCIKYEINKCVGPCLTAENYNQTITLTKELLEGKIDNYLTHVTTQMNENSKKQLYETAALWRDRKILAEKLKTKQTIIDEKRKNTNVYYIYEKNNLLAWSKLTIRNGILKNAAAGIVNIGEQYAETNTDLKKDALEELLNYENEENEKNVRILTYPKIKTTQHETLQRINQNDKKMLKIAEANAAAELKRWVSKRTNDFNIRSETLTNLANLLNLDAPAYIVEGWDISHWGGKNAVAGISVFIDGLENTKMKRSYKIPDEYAGDDLASLKWLTGRRLLNIEQKPNLIVVDGGREQLKAVNSVIEKEQILQVGTCSLAKRLEEIHIENDVLILPRNDNCLYFLQTVRDAAHKHSIVSQKKTRNTYLTSELENIDKLGTKTRQKLLTQYGSVQKISQLNVTQLQNGGISKTLAENIYKHFHPQTNSDV